MAQPQLTGEQLKVVITETLSPYGETRRTAEGRLKSSQTAPGHLLEVLRLVASSDAADAPVRQAAAVHFKNIVKKGWDVNNEDGTDGIVISPEDRNTIKSHLVQLMCTVSFQIQAQISEAISLVAAVDYPDNWQNLLPELTQQFNSTDPNVVVGVLKTANSLFKRFRYVQKSDALYAVIIYTLNGIQAPLLDLFKKTKQAVDALANDPVQLKPRFEALRLICRIFFSLNYQDLPEFFEDHMSEWMTDFATYLQYHNPALVDADEETEPSVIDNLQSAIIQNLALYTDKDEEPFLEYLPQFTSLVWNLLLGVTALPKHDTLATTSIKFLSSLVQKLMHRDLFKEESTLRQIVLNIVIPNLKFRESDEERFEDDPQEYMVTEVEGSDSESRRKCSQDLLKAMCRQFEGQTTAICSEHVGSMLSEFTSDPNGKWAAKDAAIHLMMGIAIRRESTQGVSEINEAVNVMDFFQTQILPELQDTNHASRPVLKATSIKFVSVFRNQFTRENLVQLMPLLIQHLGSPIVVVHTFAAYTIERILLAKELVGTTKQPKITSADFKPFLEPLFGALFVIIDNEEWNENDYVMKCVTRSLSKAGEDVIPVTQIVITKLTTALGRVAKNPRNPQFNHYLFESIAVLVGSVCSKDPSATVTFESLLFEPFNIILQMDIAEFTPYVFQVLAQLLEFRPRESGLGQSYTQLFQPLLTPDLWEKKGNVPALARLIQAYIKKSPSELTGSINPILGVFQKLLSLKATEGSAFDLLSSAIVHFPQEAMQPRLGTIFQLILTKLMSSKTPKYTRLVTQFFALFVGKFGGQPFVDSINVMQNGLAINLLAQVWNPRILKDPPVQRMEAKVQVVGLTKLLCETPALLADPNGQAIWAQTLAGLVTVLTSASFKATASEVDVDDDVLETQYDAQYSKLASTGAKVEDLFAEVPDPSANFVHSLHRLSSSQPGMLMPLIQQGLSADPKLLTGLQSLFQHAGVSLA